MAYRGKKCMEQERQLRKKSLLDLYDLRPQRRTAGGCWYTDTKQMREWKADPDSVYIRARRKFYAEIEAGERRAEELFAQAWEIMDKAVAITPNLIHHDIRSTHIQDGARMLWNHAVLELRNRDNEVPEIPSELIAQADLFMRQAGYCERYSPETAAYLRSESAALRARANELLEEAHYKALESRPRHWRYGRDGQVRGPTRDYESWTEERDGLRYYYEQNLGWYWRHDDHYSDCFYGFEAQEQPARRYSPYRMRKAQYTSYEVRPLYPAAFYEIKTPPFISWRYEITPAPEYPREHVTPHRDFARAVANTTREVNLMDGISYGMLTPLDTLKMISAGSIFGEPTFYREGGNECKINFESIYGYDWEYECCSPYYCSVPEDEHFRELSKAFRRMTASQVMERIIDEALSSNFLGTLNWAVELRTRFLMRLNPQVIMVRAAVHPNREEFTRIHPGKFQEAMQKVMTRGDDVIHQMEYWFAKTGTKRRLPAILKRAWAKRIGSMDAYSMAKYCHSGTGLIDAVRLCHAKGPLVDTLMRTGRVPMPEGQDTWERLRASGMGWKEILGTIRMPHMALLRNLRGIFSEVEDPEILREALELLKRGVKGGKQFPFRYYTAWKIFEDEKSSWLWDAIDRLFTWHNRVQAALNDCVNLACGNLPELHGRCAFLTDNSGSAWGAYTSEHGSISMAEIGNLSSVIGAMRADKGIVYPFGDCLRSVEISRDIGVLEQAHLVNKIGLECGIHTENGLYNFFNNAIASKQHWDNIFVYSDMQTGTGRRFGINPSTFRKMGALLSGGRIDVNKLVHEYRCKVNPRVNVCCIQTAGYTNAVMPEYGYRSSVLCGWTGQELVFADAVSQMWDEIERRGEKGEDTLMRIDPEKVNLAGF